MKIRNAATAGFLAAFLAGNALASEAPSVLEFVRPLGMGGAFTALSDDHNSFTYNPAGIVQRTGPEFTILELVGGGSEDAKKAINFINDNHDKLTNFDHQPADQQIKIVDQIDDTISRLHPHVYLGADFASYISGPGYKDMHLGFGLLGVADARFQLYNGATTPLIDYAINNDIQLPVSLAKRFDAPFHMPGKLGFGLTGKYIQRRQITETRLSVLALQNFNAPPLTMGHGLGMDAGTLYQPTDRLNIGLMVRDIFGTKMHFSDRATSDGFPAEPSRTSIIRPQTNIGVAYVPHTYLFGFGRTNDRLTLALDVDDVAPSNDQHVFFQNGLKKPIGDNIGTHMRMGAEFRYWFLRFRGGAYQGYPTLGLGVDIPVLKIDYAYFSRELGERAGDIREKNHVISVALRFGSGNTESRERIVKAKESERNQETSAPAESSSGSNDSAK